VDGVDFVLGKASPQKVGRKALAVNLSDIAAMGGEPMACVIALGIPPRLTERWLGQFYRGLVRLAKKYNTLCAGGDISRSRQFFVSIALLGKVPAKELVTRGGARAGDWIGVTGRLGGSILGRHLDFEPRIREARFLASRFHPSSMIDISDGLLQDLDHILKQSGVGARLDIQKIPISQEAKKLAAGHAKKALEHALTDGEDFELLFTVSPSKAKKLTRAWKNRFSQVPLTWIGVVTKEKGKVTWTYGSESVRSPRFHQPGYRHF
jgi:thiamine-monophosphate kinase